MKFSDMPYERVDIEQMKKEFSSLMIDLDRAGSGEEQFEVHKRFYSLTDKAMTQMTIAHIRHDIDTTDEFYSAEQDYYDKNQPVFMQLVTSYQKKLYNSPFRPYLEEKIGPVAFRNMELAMKSVDERIIPLMQEENALQTRYNKLLATAKIEWEGETLNLSLMNPYLRNKDRQVRARAWEKFTGFLSGKQEELDEIYDLLVKNRTAQAEKLGYDNYLPLGDCRMRRNCYSRSDIRDFRAQVKKDLVPFAEKLHDIRRSQLGLGELKFIDESVYYPDGDPAPFGTPEQILEAGRKMYGELSPETGEFMDFMCENDLFDVLGRKTKRTGGYMTYLPDYGSPFIFANFNGTSGDINVITHECGHAFQGYLSGKDPIREHSDITMETAETHSMSMEFFTQPWMELFFGEQAERYRREHFMSSICFVPYGTMVDEFQDIAYTNPGLTPKARCEMWNDLERQYRPHMDYSGCRFFEEGHFWQKQHHIYGFPLYYIDYCISSIDALQYKIWMDKDYKEAWESYLNLCRWSASDFFTGMIPRAGLTLPFEDGCISWLVKKLSEKIL